MAKPTLAEYERKRDFSKTPEPAGKADVTPSQRLRFVIQKHAATRLHYDLRLEYEGVFLSWAVTRGPSLDPEQKRLAVETEPHPLDYGDFEGTIPKGQYGGGTVMLWDRGYWESDPAKPIDKGLEHGHLLVRFDGERLKGAWHLVKIKNDKGGGKRTNWLLFKAHDGAEIPGASDELLTENLTSVASGRTMEEIAAGVGKAPTPFITRRKSSAKAVWTSNRAEEGQPKAPPPSPPPSPGKTKRAKGKRAAMPEFVEPQTCRLASNPPPGGGWAHEIKFDGYRIQMRVEGGKVVLRSRSGLDWTHRFPEIAAAAAGWPDGLFDGEIVGLNDKGMPHFPHLTSALSSGKTAGLVFYVFDLLFEEGLDLRELPLTERKQRLAELVEAAPRPGERLRYVDHFITPGGAVLESACRMDLEGIVSKRVEAPYRSGRQESWIKAKCRGGQEVVIAGFTTEGERFRSLIAGVHREGRFVHVGRIGTGFSQSTGASLLKRLKRLEADQSPFSGKGAPKKAAGVHWVRPELVAEVEHAGWTADGSLRQAAFKGLREDKQAEDVVDEAWRDITQSVAANAAEAAVADAERGADPPAPKTKAPSPKPPEAGTTKPGGSAEVRRVVITKADKPLWPATDTSPAYTKLDLAEYLDTVGERMLPHFRGRPVSIIRTPDGIEGERFFQRHAMPGQSPLVTLMDVRERKPYIAADTVEALLALGQVGATEFHPWNCHPFEVELPGRFVFDLDPDEGLNFDDVIRAAKDLRDRLSELGLVPFCKTTGGKGLHVVTPLAVEKTPIDWPTAKAFTRAVCAELAAAHPDRYTLNMAKKARTGRIFLDYLRNDRMSTAVGPYSPRARPGATVSTPISWSQVKKGLDPRAYTMSTVPGLLNRADPWADYAEAAQPLSAAIKRLGPAAMKAA